MHTSLAPPDLRHDVQRPDPWGVVPNLQLATN